MKSVLIVVVFVAVLVAIYFFVIKKQQTYVSPGVASLPIANQPSGGFYSTVPVGLSDAAKALPVGSGSGPIDQLIISALQNSNKSSFNGHY